MNVLLAGATGAVGVPIVRALRAAGDRVTGIVRSETGARLMQSLGAESIHADVLDRDALLRAVDRLEFDAVVHEVTALKKPPTGFSGMSGTNDLRVRGTRHLLEAAHAVAASRFVTQSIVVGYGCRDHGGAALTESAPFGRSRGDRFAPVIQAISSAETQIFDDPDVEGIALRYGLFYGGDIAAITALLRHHRLPVTAWAGTLAMVHHDDAAAATVAALRRGRPDTAYNIVDDTPVTWRDYATTAARSAGVPVPQRLPAWLVRAVAPYFGRVVTEMSINVANTAAADELGWRPRYPSCADGIRASLAAASASAA